MQLSNVRDWLKTLDVAENYYIGRLDNKKERSLGVYARRGSGRPVMALGGLTNSGYGILRVSLLLHWNRNARETEEAARALWDAVCCVTDIDISAPGTVSAAPSADTEGASDPNAEAEEAAPVAAHIQYVQPNVPEPVAVGTDDGGVYEYVIELNIYYRR